MTDTAGRERRAAARIETITHEQLIADLVISAKALGYTEAAGTPGRFSQERVTNLRAELLRRLNATDAASAAAGSGE